MRGRPRIMIVAALLFVAVVLSTIRVLAGAPGTIAVKGVDGPQLFLIGQATPEQLRSVASLTVLAEVQSKHARQYIASGAASALAKAQAAGLDVKVLDANTRGNVYYFVDTQATDAQATDAQRFASAHGVIVFSGDNELLVAVPAAKEKALLDAVASLDIDVQLLSSQPLALQERALPATIGIAASGPDSRVAALLTQVTAAKLSGLIGSLSGEQPVSVGGVTLTLATRYTFAGGVNDARRYIHQYFAGLGLAVSDVNWTYGRYSGVNVIADLRGVRNPERIWLIGGHYDDRSEIAYTRAPGADDNASGVAATMLMASLLRDYQFNDTIRFVAFSGEEEGEWGSKSYAAQLSSAGAQVMGYIDVDMLAYDGNNDRAIELHSSTRASSVQLANAFASANTRYNTGLVIQMKQADASRFSDHSSFWDKGFPAIMAIEDFFADSKPADHTPSYHTSRDRLSTLRTDYAVSYSQAALATIAELAGIGGNAPATATTTATATSTATATKTATATSTRTPGPGQCRDLLSNGNMETQQGWIFGSTARKPGYVTTPIVSGARSLRLGIEPATADYRSYSSAYQSVTIPANALSAVLTASIRRGTQDSKLDYQEILLLNPSFHVLRILQRSLGTDATWQPVRFDLAGYRGQSVVVYNNVYNDGNGRRSWMYVDDMQLTVCMP
jgi:hypothetical protein